jgi:nucleoside-diphosphate-sugar epimerase
MADERPITSEEQLDDLLSAPPPALAGAMEGIDLLVLGAGGKMGPTLCRMAARAGAHVVAVSRFTDDRVRGGLERAGIETIACDLLTPGAMDALPRCRHILYAAARKFGSTGAESETWATNAYLAGEAARAFPQARFVAFSTGNVYPFWPVGGAGPTEDAAPGPVGEYAQSCLARERIFEHFSRRNGTPVTLLRLNYAVELRYGVLVDLATRMKAGAPIDVTTGHANVIWQGDASAYALRSFALGAAPPAVLNVTGPLVRIREVAERLGEKMGLRPSITGAERPEALLSDAARCHALFGPPAVSLETMIAWVAHWVTRGGATWGKPTKFQVRDGRF